MCTRFSHWTYRTRSISTTTLSGEQRASCQISRDPITHQVHFLYSFAYSISENLVNINSMLLSMLSIPNKQIQSDAAAGPFAFFGSDPVKFSKVGPGSQHNNGTGAVRYRGGTVPYGILWSVGLIDFCRAVDLRSSFVPIWIWIQCYVIHFDKKKLEFRETQFSFLLSVKIFKFLVEL